MPEYFKDVLPNGLRVVTVEMPHLHCAEMVCYVKVGGQNEVEEVAGISHFLEHMLFRGTEDFPCSFDLERAFESIGGTVNASTDAETSCFHSRVHPDEIDRGAALFASMLRRPLFAEIEIERRIILEEAMEDLNEQGDDINTDNLTARLLWPDSPLCLPTIGTRRSIQGVGLEQIKTHHRRFYAPQNTVLVAAGKVCHQDFLASAKRHFGDWTGALPAAPVEVFKGITTTPQAVWVRDSDSQVAVQLAFAMPGRRSRHAMALRVLCRVLCGGGTSRLMLRLREELGLTYNVDSSLSLYDHCGCFTVDLTVAPENLAAAVYEILAVFQDLCARPISEKELARVARGFLYDLDFSRDQPDDSAIRYGWGELVGYLRTIEQDRRELSMVTPAELHQTASELFAQASLKAAFVGPFKEEDRPVVEGMLKGYRA